MLYALTAATVDAPQPKEQHETQRTHYFPRQCSADIDQWPRVDPGPMTVPASAGQARGGGRSRAGLALGLICAAQFVLQLDFSIVNVALPSIQRELGLVASQLQWIVTGYALTFGSLLLLGGRAADLLGRRRLLVVGLALFAIASLGAGLAQSSLVLI